MSWQDVDPGEEGFIYRPYNDGVSTDVAYNEGTQFIAPWNEMITYNVLVQSRSYESQVMDKNGTDIGVVIAVNYHAIKGQTAASSYKPATLDNGLKINVPPFVYPGDKIILDRSLIHI